MLLFIVFAIAVANLGLGYALAVYHAGGLTIDWPLVWQPAWAGLRDRLNMRRQHDDLALDSLLNEPEISDPTPDTSSPDDPPLEADVETDLAAIARLGSDDTLETAATDILAALQTLRETVVDVDWRLRQADDELNTELLSTSVDEIKTSCKDYLSQNALTAAALSRGEEFEKDSELGHSMARFNQALCRESEQIEAVLLDFDSLDLQQEVETRCAKFLSGCERLHDAMWLLHDDSQSALANVLATSGVLELTSKHPPFDPITTLPDAATLQTQLARHWRDDPLHHRTISLALVDPCQIRPICSQHGLRLADDVLREVGRLLSQLAKTHEDDLVTRLDTHRLAVLFIDSGPRNSSCVIERVRQTLERTWFEFSGQRVQTTLSIGVTDSRPDDTLAMLVQRATNCVEAAKAAGGNKTFLDDGRGPMVVKPPEFEIEKHVQRLQL